MAKKKAFTKGKPKAGKATKSPFKVADTKSKKKPKEVKSNLKKVIDETAATVPCFAYENINFLILISS